MTILSPTHLAQFQSEGYLILKNILPRSTVDAVQRELEQTVDELAGSLRQKGKITDLRHADPFDTRLKNLYANCMELAPASLRGDYLHRPGYFPMLFNPDLLDIVETLLGPEIRLYPNYTVRPKFPDDPKTLVLWHQDAAYTDVYHTNNGVDNLRMVNVWSPLVPATTHNGCMQFIPGTHKLGLVKHIQKEYYLEIAQEELAPRLQNAVNIELNPQDIVLFSNLLFHVGLPNKSTHIRWSLDWRYQDATQPTLRKAQGHLARSRSQPAAVVQDPTPWSRLQANFT